MLTTSSDNRDEILVSLGEIKGQLAGPIAPRAAQGRRMDCKMMPCSCGIILACCRSGQISERQWQEHLKDEVFRQWLEKQGHTTPT